MRRLGWQTREISSAKHDPRARRCGSTHQQGKTGRVDPAAGTPDASALAGPDRSLLDHHVDQATDEDHATGCGTELA
jgi:hypothetical protein